MNLDEILTVGVKARCSDIHIKTGLPPVVRIDSKLRPIPNMPRLTGEDVTAMAASIMNDRQKQRFQESYEADLAYSVPGLGRFRVNVYSQRGTIALVFRAIPYGAHELLRLKYLERVKGRERLELDQFWDEGSARLVPRDGEVRLRERR